MMMVLACLIIPCLSLLISFECQDFSCQHLMCVMTCLSFVLVYDDNLLCLLCVSSFTCSMSSCMISIRWLHPCLLICLVYACLLACLVCVTKFSSKIGFPVGSHPSIYTKPETHFQELSFLVRVSSTIQSNEDAHQPIKLRYDIYEMAEETTQNA